MATDPKGQPSGYIMDLIGFLRSTFIAFTNLPVSSSLLSLSPCQRLPTWQLSHDPLQEKVAQTACMSACKHIASLLMRLLKDEEVKSLSLGALQQLNLDLVQCERKNPGLGVDSAII